MHSLKQRLAHLLLDKSYKEGNFILASGKKSEYYFDCRQTALHPEGAWLIGSLFFEMIKNLPIVGVGGMTLGSDPLITATSVISWEKGRPLNGFIVRKESKGHGTNQYVEGLANFNQGDKVVLLEDVVTTGGSILTACQRAEAVGLEVIQICSVLDREEGGREKLQQAGYSLAALFNRKELVKHRD